MIEALLRGVVDFCTYVDRLPDSVFAAVFLTAALIVVIGSWLFPGE